MKVALTGGTGFLGGHLIEALVAEGHTVRALVRPRAGRVLPEREGLEWFEGALWNPDSLRQLVGGTDAVLHAAYTGESEKFVESNLAGTAWLIENSAATSNKQFVFVSSLSVYGVDFDADARADGLRRDEDFALWPREVYGAHKAGLEKLVFAAGEAFGMNASSFRLGWCLGVREPWEKNAFAAVVDDALEHGEVRTANGGYVIAAEDAARILARAVGEPGAAGQVLNTFDRWYDFRDAAPTLGELLGREIGVACDASPEPRVPIENGRLLERGIDFRTDERVHEMLAELLRRRGALPR